MTEFIETVIETNPDGVCIDCFYNCEFALRERVFVMSQYFIPEYIPNIQYPRFIEGILYNAIKTGKCGHYVKW